MTVLRRATLVQLSLMCLALLVVNSVSAATATVDTVLGPGPGIYRLHSSEREVHIPFELFRGDIRMLGQVNGQPVRMFIDNGHLWDDLLFFGSARVDSLGLARSGSIAIGSGNGGDPVLADTAQDLTISFPGITFSGQDAVITRYDPSQPNIWEGAEGQVSAAFLKHFVVGLDFEAGILTLTEPSRFRYTGAGVELPLIPLPDQAWAIPVRIELTDGRLIETDMMMDLGIGGVLSILTGGPHEVLPPAKAIAARLGFSVAGPIMGHIGRVSGVTMGGFRITEPLTTFDDSGCTLDYTEFMVGMAAFRRFHVIFDYPGRRLFLEPNTFFGEPTEFNMSGLFLAPTPNREWTVARVLPDSPGAEAGLIVGDLITAIDGRPSTVYKFWDLDPLMRREGQPLRLRIKRDDDSIREVTLILRRML